jgi:acetyl esterase/lipase
LAARKRLDAVIDLMWMRVRFVIACVAFVLSLLVVVPASNHLLWICTIVVTEWGYWLALALIGLLVAELSVGRGIFRMATSTLCVAAIVLYALPFVEGLFVAAHLPAGLSEAFGAGAGSLAPASPLQFRKLWWSGRLLGKKQGTFSYHAADGTPLSIDFFSDDSAGDRPCIVVVHGGAWHSGSPEELENWNLILSGLGYRVASISYRFAPAHVWPAQKQDLLAALAYLKEHASELKIDPTRLVLLGRSAGAQIVLATAYAAKDPSIRGCIASYAPTDMDFDYGPAASHSFLNAHKVLGQFLGGTLSEKPDVYKHASPLQLANSHSPPTLLAQGTRDEIVWIENSRKLRDRLKQLHRPVFLLELPWATHGFDANPNGPGGQLEFYAMRWFLEATMSTPEFK